MSRPDNLENDEPELNQQEIDANALDQVDTQAEFDPEDTSSDESDLEEEPAAPAPTPETTEPTEDEESEEDEEPAEDSSLTHIMTWNKADMYEYLLERGIKVTKSKLKKDMAFYVQKAMKQGLKPIEVSLEREKPKQKQPIPNKHVQPKGKGARSIRKKQSKPKSKPKKPKSEPKSKQDVTDEELESIFVDLVNKGYTDEKAIDIMRAKYIM